MEEMAKVLGRVSVVWLETFVKFGNYCVGCWSWNHEEDKISSFRNKKSDVYVSYLCMYVDMCLCLWVVYKRNPKGKVVVLGW